MYMVIIGGKKHSIWNTKKEGYHQRSVLYQHGYKQEITVEYIDANYENGHYFV